MASLPLKKVAVNREGEILCPSARVCQGFRLYALGQILLNIACAKSQVFVRTPTRQLSFEQSAWAGQFPGIPGYLLAGVLFSLPSIVWAEESPKIQRVGDWELLCDQSANPQEGSSVAPRKTASRCKAVQRLTVKETDETVFVIKVLPGEKAEPVAIVSVPLGGYLVLGVEFTVDGRKPYKLLIETCTAAGCHTGFPLSGRVDKDMRTGKVANFRIWSSKSKSADIRVSVNGFADAMAHLERRP